MIYSILLSQKRVTVVASKAKIFYSWAEINPWDTISKTLMWYLASYGVGKLFCIKLSIPH